MTSFIPDNGIMIGIIEKGMACKYGQMDPNLKDFSKMIVLRVLADLFILMEMFILVNG